MKVTNEESRATPNEVLALQDSSGIAFRHSGRIHNDATLETLLEKMNDLGGRFGGLEQQMSSLDGRVSSLEDRMFVRLDRIESEVKQTHSEFYELRADFRELRSGLREHIPALKA